MRNRSVLNSPRLREVKKKRRTVFFRKAGIVFLFFAIILVALAFASRWGKLNISEVKVSGVTSEDAEMIEKIIQERIDGKYFFLFPKSNVLLFSRTNISEELARDYKRFKNINVTVPKTSTLEVSLAERKAEFLWCGNEFIFSSEIGQCYFMDETGYIFDEAPYFSGDVYFKFYGKADDDDDPRGVYFIQQNFSEIDFFRELLSDIGVRPASLYAKDESEMEFYLHSTSGAMPPKIIFKPTDDFVKLSENLQSAMSTDPLKSDFKKKYDSLEYIDLRFGNRVYYRFR
ncbi:MAG TPA: hypothetical protein VFQ59_03360 [Candidatus Paceibacterota bacterium]|nr:hypothetical protein [Candidatus Paceibacterota bacterium]